MIVNEKSLDGPRVKFISYDGKYPNLCSGVLILEIDGKEYKFGHNYDNFRRDPKTDLWTFTDEDPNNPNFERFWCSGGNVSFNSNWDASVESGEWKIDVDDLPNQFWDVADEIDRVINENVPWGCCGGCI